jgi:rod shape-determining protein MreC
MALRPLIPFDSDKRRVFLGIVLLAGLLSLLDSRGALGILTSARQGLVLLTNPFTSVTAGISKPVSDFFTDWSQVGSKNEIIAELRKENAELIAQIQSLPDAERKIKEVDQLLQTAGLGQFKIVVARVISIGSSSGFGSTALIDAGSIDGISPNMTVMAGSGMVGRVLSVARSTSIVVLMNDSTSTIGARVAENGKIGFLTGQGLRNDLILEFVDPTATVEVGNRLLSYGVTGGIFATGIPLGVVEEVTYEGGNSVLKARVRPFVDLQNLDFVGVVITKPRTDPRDALLPTPTVAPTVTVTVTAVPTSQPTLSVTPNQSTLSATPNSLTAGD